ncbi:MAG: choice-of-anchor J domain-containing protein [Prevotella sp.]|nr:choice-of-anchor J domain-containing protein [Prevotella sp.]
MMNTIKTFFFSALTALCLPVQLHAQDAEIWVSFIDNPNRETNGVYGFPASDPSAIAAKKTAPELYFQMGTGYQDGIIYGMDYKQGFFTPDRYILYSIDTKDWTVSQKDVDKKFALQEAACGMDGTVYAQFSDGVLGKIDYKNLTRTDIATPGRTYAALGVTSVDELYGIDTEGNLVRINTNNGAETVVGQIGFGIYSYKGSTGEIDPVTNRFYLLTTPTWSDPTTLYSIDLATAQATKIGELPVGYDYMGGMIIVGEPAAAGSPAKATNLKASFEGSSLSGTFSFTAPTETFDHQPLEGEMTYTLSYGTDEGAKQTLTGTVNAGATVTKDITLSEGGNVTFTVRLSNASGEGQTASLTQWIGPDAPLAPTNVVMTMDADGHVDLSWTAPTATVNGGYMGTITYNVYRIESGEETLVAQDLTTTTFSETLEITTLKEYQYAVVANNEGTLSQRALSNKQVAGDGFGVPFVEQFGEGNHLEYFTIINVNGDSDRWGELTWKVHTSGGYWDSGQSYEEMWCQTDGNTDDWLITPPLQLQPGKAYALTFKMKAGYNTTPEKFEVTMGRTATVEGQTTTLIAERTITNTDYVTFTKEFTVSEAASYCIGFHAMPNVGSALYLDDVEVRIGASQDAPAQVDNLKVEADVTGALKATVSFNAPTTTIGGAALTSISKIEVMRDEQLVATIDNPAVGSSQSVDDNGPKNGYNNYTVVAYNEAGNGLRAEMEKVYVGVDIPQAPVVTMIQDNLGSVHFEWAEASATGANGYVVRPADVTYSVYATNADGSQGELLYEGKERQLDADYADTEAFDIAKWLIVAENVAGTSKAGAAKIATGVPMLLPYRETFAMGYLKTSIWTEQSGVRSFNPSTEDAATEDAGSLMFMPFLTGDNSSYNTPRLTFAGVKQPTLTFFHKAEAGSASKVVAKIWQADGTETVLTEADYTTLTTNGWTKETIDLTAFKQQDFVVVKFFAQGEAGKAIFIDDVTIRDGAFDDEAVIPTAISLSSTPITHHPSPVYDLQGRLVYRGYEGTEVRGYESSIVEGEEGNLAPSHPRTPAPSMKNGIYIINGKKYIK